MVQVLNKRVAKPGGAVVDTDFDDFDMHMMSQLANQVGGPDPCGFRLCDILAYSSCRPVYSQARSTKEYTYSLATRLLRKHAVNTDAVAATAAAQVGICLDIKQESARLAVAAEREEKVRSGLRAQQTEHCSRQM